MLVLETPLHQSFRSIAGICIAVFGDFQLDVATQFSRFLERFDLKFIILF
jgi:hypothetical protein